MVNPFKKKKQPKTVPVPSVNIHLEKPGVPTTFKPADVVLITRWVNEAGDEQLTTDVLTEVPQENEKDQYMIALGMLHISTHMTNRDLFRLMNPGGVLATPETDPSQFPTEEVEPISWEDRVNQVAAEEEAFEHEMDRLKDILAQDDGIIDESLSMTEERQARFLASLKTAPHDDPRACMCPTPNGCGCIVSAHDHPCSDPACVECWEVTKKMKKEGNLP